MIEDSFRRSDFLSGITEPQASDILNRGNLVRLKSGEILVHQGDPAYKSFLVLNGRIKLIKLHEEGKEAILRYIGPGETTAILSVFKGKEYPATAETVGTTEAVGWDKQTMVQLMLEYPPLADYRLIRKCPSMGCWSTILARQHYIERTIRAVNELIR